VNTIAELSAWVSGHADRIALSAAVLIGAIAVTVAAVRTRRAPVSRRLLALSVALTTGLSADSMWRVAGRTLGLSGVEQWALFAFGEVALLTAAALVNEALTELRTLATAQPDSDEERQLNDASRKSALGRARGFALLVWIVAAGVGAAATTAATSRAEAAIRIVPPLLVAGFWWAGLDRSGLAVTRETITSVVSLRRLAVRLHLAQPGALGLEEADRERRLQRLAGRLYAYHQAKPGHRRNLADWRLTRADRAARRYLDDAGRRIVREQLAARYALRDSTTPAALSATNPWLAPDTDNVIEGTVVDTRPLADSPADSGTAVRAGQPDSCALDRRTAAADSRTVVSITGRTASHTVEEMAAWLSGQPACADGIPGRPTVRAALRGQFGSCSTDRARDVMALLSGQRPDSDRTADSGQRTATGQPPTTDAEETAS
jgi:hypothetical protein